MPRRVLLLFSCSLMSQGIVIGDGNPWYTGFRAVRKQSRRSHVQICGTGRQNGRQEQLWLTRAALLLLAASFVITGRAIFDSGLGGAWVD
jgi:hypothetical protein